MAYVEEVFQIGGREPGLRGAHTGKLYPKKDVETINGQMWSKPRYFQPNVINYEIEEVEGAEDNTNRDEKP